MIKRISVEVYPRHLRRCRNAGLPPHAAGGLSPGAGLLSIPMGRAFWMLPPHPERKSWGRLCPVCRQPDAAGQAGKDRLPQHQRPRAFLYPQRPPWGWFRWTRPAGGCKIIPSHHHRVSYRSSSPMPFGNQAARRFRHPQPVALPFPSICAPGSPRKPCETFILTMRPCY